jgi:hypothetical protein
MGVEVGSLVEGVGEGGCEHLQGQMTLVCDQTWVWDAHAGTSGWEGQTVAEAFGLCAVHEIESPVKTDPQN